MNNIIQLVHNIKPKIYNFICSGAIKLADVDDIFVINLSKESAKRNYIIKLLVKIINKSNIYLTKININIIILFDSK